ncbi:MULTISPECIES: flagellar basal body rod C-terminal domain-containing protein [Acidithrix]|uniref:Flagellar basal-body rod protein FlgC n=1 Tax=Acidithrix ferrooxidans TaxID=1280514 RepID=A0A0D8HFK0_9ACTN|nr:MULTISPECIES: flagellar basal body rod C-terminal domain-containing protein [Acidithrix]KJF16567.1 flagellar basal-body rod protein FlgC [Acidithrix ferrooxidans]CAG4933378.1 unnamed protein product [Acidithrix sp. C25]
MSLFGLLSISGSGIDTNQTWLNAIGSNIANINDAVNPAKTPFLQQEIVAAPGAVPTGYGPSQSAIPTSPLNGMGVHVAAVTTNLPNGVLTYDPTSPVANASGYVRTPGISLADQLGNLNIAEANYQANVAVINHAKSIYQSALTLAV